MKKRNAGKMPEKMDRYLVRDIGFLFVASCFVLVKLFGYSIEMAALLSPLVIIAVLTGVYLFIQTLWVMMRVSDKLSAVFNIKRSPLA